MLKKSNMKTLAVALCATTMTGLYAMTADAQELYVKDTSIIGERVTVSGTEKNKITSIEGLNSIQIGDTKLTSQNIVTKGDLQTAVNKAVDNKGFVNQVDQKIVDGAQNTAIKANTSAIEENKAAIAKKANAENVYTKAEIDAKDFQTATDVSATVNAAVANKADKADLKDFVTNEAVADVSKSIRDDFQKADNTLKGELEQTIKNEVDQKANKAEVDTAIGSLKDKTTGMTYDEAGQTTKFDSTVEANHVVAKGDVNANRDLYVGNSVTIKGENGSIEAANGGFTVNVDGSVQSGSYIAAAGDLVAGRDVIANGDATIQGNLSVGEITNVEQELKNNKADITKVSEENALKNAQQDRLIDSNYEAIKQLSGNVADAKAENVAQNAVIEANKAASEAMDSTLLAGITGVKNKLEQAKGDIAENTGKINANTAAIEANKAASEAMDSTLLAGITGVKNKLEQAKGDIAENTGKINANTAAIEANKAASEAMDNTLLAGITGVKGKLEQAQKEISDNSAQIVVNTNKITDNAANIKANSAAIEALDKQHTEDIVNVKENISNNYLQNEANKKAIESEVNRATKAEAEIAKRAEEAVEIGTNAQNNAAHAIIDNARQDKEIKANADALAQEKVDRIANDNELKQIIGDEEFTRADADRVLDNKIKTNADAIGANKAAIADLDAKKADAKDVFTKAQTNIKVNEVRNELKEAVGDIKGDIDDVHDRIDVKADKEYVDNENKLQDMKLVANQREIDSLEDYNIDQDKAIDANKTAIRSNQILNNKVNAEQNEAIEANKNALAQEKVDRIANDNELKQRIGDEEFTRADADRVLDNKIKTNAEAIAQEKADRVAADAELQIGVDVAQASADAANLKNAEQDKVLAKHELDIENAARNNERQDKEIKANAEAIAQEKADRVAADTKLQGNLDAEAAARAEADTKLQSNLDAEAAARAEADTKLQGNLDAEAAARAEADTKLQGNLDAEAAARAEADTKLQGNLDAEAAARAEADTKLQGNLDAEAAARAEADTKLQGNLDAEAAARAAADTKLQKNIDAEAKVRADADTKLQENIDAEAKVRAEADTKLQGNIDKEAGLREAADTRLDNRITSLDGKVEKVGAGAAALAALHPMDFDADDKLSFAAGVGNYGSETASALGVFYRPTEKVMLSAAGTLGTGENMVNMGLSFALDKKNNVSNTRVAMAQEIVDLRAHVAQQEVQIQKLMLMVAKLSNTDGVAAEAAVAAEAMAPKAAEMFPDVPENHWAYDYIAELQAAGVLEGYENGYFEGDKTMTRYEFAAMLFRAMEKGVILNSQISEEFKNELGRIRVDRIKGLDADTSKVERVRVVSDGNRDDYGYQLD